MADATPEILNPEELLAEINLAVAVRVEELNELGQEEIGALEPWNGEHDGTEMHVGSLRADEGDRLEPFVTVESPWFGDGDPEQYSFILDTTEDSGLELFARRRGESFGGSDSFNPVPLASYPDSATEQLAQFRNSVIELLEAEEKRERLNLPTGHEEVEKAEEEALEMSLEESRHSFSELIAGSLGESLLTLTDAAKFWGLEVRTVVVGDQAAIEIELPDNGNTINLPRLRLFGKSGVLSETQLVCNVPIDGSEKPVEIVMKGQPDGKAGARTSVGLNNIPFNTTDVGNLLFEPRNAKIAEAAAEMVDSLGILYDKERFAYNFETMSDEQATKIIDETVAAYIAGQLRFPDGQRSYRRDQYSNHEIQGGTLFGDSKMTAQAVAGYQATTEGGMIIQVSFTEKAYQGGGRTKAIKAGASQSTDKLVSPQISIGLERDDSGKIKLTTLIEADTRQTDAFDQAITKEPDEATLARILEAKRELAKIIYLAFYHEPEAVAA